MSLLTLMTCFGLQRRYELDVWSQPFCKPDPPLSPARVRYGRFAMNDVKSFEDTGASEMKKESTGYCSVHFVFRLGEGFYRPPCRDDEISVFRTLDGNGSIPMTG